MQRVGTLLWWICAVSQFSTVEAQDALTILHTNDFHSRFEPIKANGATCTPQEDQAGECIGGAARLAALTAELRAARDNTILIDAGDQFQGSALYTYHKDGAVSEIMNLLGYDVMAVGNHEFDDGPETLGAFARAANFPVLLSNADYSKDPDLSDTLLPRATLDLGDMTLGILGVAPADTGEQPSAGQNISFKDPIPVLRSEVDGFTSRGVAKIILVSHLGYELDKEIASQVSGIDVIVGGNSNTVLSNTVSGAEGPYPTMVRRPDGAMTAIVQAGSLGRYLGELKVTFDTEGDLSSATGDIVAVSSEIAADAEVKARVADLAVPLDAYRSDVLSKLETPLEGSREICRTGECSMGNLLADASLAYFEHADNIIAIQSGGGLRRSLEAGNVTRGDILEVLPFQNTLATVELSGADIIAALENGVSRVEEEAGRFPQVAGLRYRWSRVAPPGAGRILSVDVLDNVSFAPIVPDKTFTVVTNSFMAQGGDGYEIFAEKGASITDEGIPLDLIVSDYLAAKHSYSAVLDGRVVEE